jgi:hypothetical protein
MINRALGYAIIFLLMVAGPVTGAGGDAAVQARQGFEEILDLWRAENYEGLYARLEPRSEKGWEYFAQRIVYASRLPACCWEKLQEVKTSVIDPDTVIINARVGFEVEGVGTRFVVRDFTLHRSGGVWRLPMQLILDLADYNIQRIPRKIYERRPD